MEKRGQITIFIIIGLIILITVGLFFWFTAAIIPEPVFIEPQLEPINRYVGICLAQVATDAVTTLGLNGGYITFPEFVEANPQSYLGFGPIKDLKNPYWWYAGIEAIPTQEFIQTQISDYIDTNLKECVGNFEDLRVDYNIIEKSLPQSKVTLTAEYVQINTNYELKVETRRNKTVTTIDTFLSIVPVRLKAMYELAKDIMEAEQRDQFLEKKTIDLIAVDNSIPYINTEINCRPRIWSIATITQKLKQLLQTNLGYLHVKNTKYNPNAFVPSPFGTSTYNESYFNYHYIWEIGEQQYPTTTTAFSFDQRWPFYLAVSPSRGDTLRSNTQQGTNLLQFLCLQVYHFTYDVIYPVKVTLVDERTEKHDRFIFSFPFMVSINHNQPDRSNFAKASFEGSDRPTNEEFCSDTRNFITIFTEDNRTGQPALDVNLTFKCGGFTCPLGTSDWLGFGAAAGIQTNLPYCTSAIMRTSSPNYAESSTFIQTDIPDKIYTLFLNPIKQITKYKVVKHPAFALGQQQTLEPGERASIIISLVNTTTQTFATYPSDTILPITFLAKNDYTYEVNVYLIKDEALTGGYKTQWTVPWNILSSSDEIIFHVVESEAVGDIEQQMFIASLDQYSKQIPSPELR